jgi:transcription elongation factor Elf1
MSQLLCPNCNSKQVKLKIYKEEMAYMGTWIHCKRCGVHTQVASNLTQDARKDKNE